MLTDAASLRIFSHANIGTGQLQYEPSVVVVSVDVEYLLALNTHDTATNSLVPEQRRSNG